MQSLTKTYQMKKLFLASILFLSVSLSFSQTSTQLEYTKIVLQNDSIVKADLLFSTTDYYYFRSYYTNGEKGNQQIFRIPTSQVKSCEGKKFKGKMSISNEFLKFSSQAQTGIVLSLLGTAAMVIVPIAVVSTLAVVPGGAIAVIGFIVWADSYSHTKKIGVMMEAQDYPLH